jgi:hypothetical protein
MPLASYRASAEPVLHEIREVAGHRQSAKQVPNVANPVGFYEATVVITNEAPLTQVRDSFEITSAPFHASTWGIRDFISQRHLMP